MADRDVIADFLERFTDQPYRLADVLIGRLDTAGLMITDAEADSSAWRQLEAERDRLQAAARQLVAAAKAWTRANQELTAPEVRERAVNALGEAIDAFDPMLSETTEPLSITGREVSDEHAPTWLWRQRVRDVVAERDLLRDFMAEVYFQLAPVERRVEPEGVPALLRAAADERDRFAGAIEDLRHRAETAEAERDQLRSSHRAATDAADAAAEAVGAMADKLTAMRAEQDRLRDEHAELQRQLESAGELEAELDRLRTQNNKRAGILLHLASILGDAPIRTDAGLPETVAELLAGQIRLRPVVEAVRTYRNWVDITERPEGVTREQYAQTGGTLLQVLGAALDRLDAGGKTDE